MRATVARTFASITSITAAGAFAAVAVLALAACDVGPGYEPAPGENGAPYPSLVASRAMRSTAPVSNDGSPAADASPLLDDDGEPMPSLPAAVPRGTATSSTGRLYATRVQARTLAGALGSAAIDVDADRCATSMHPRASADAAACVLREVSARHRPDRGNIALLVHAVETARAEVVVDQLRSAGWRRVWVVTEGANDKVW